jgi:hypothetical protein
MKSKFFKTSKILKILWRPLLIFLVSPSSWSYIPHSHYILERTAQNHGNGLYLIDQDIVIYSAQQNPIKIKEQWLIEGGEKMRVRVYGQDDSSNDIQFTYLYDKNIRKSVDPQAVVRSSALSSEFFEPIFHFRTPEFAKSFLYKLNILPREGLQAPLRFSKPEQVQRQNENFVRLSRFDGTVNYAIGPHPKSNSLLSGLWVEQDQFHIKKLRTPDQVEVIAQRYQRFANNLWLAQNREIRWGEYRAVIQVMGVKHHDRNSPLKARLNLAQFDPKKESSLIPKLPENPVLVEFYRRFR